MEALNPSRSYGQPILPPGFRFHPTDEELVVHYLKKKASSCPLPVHIIADIDLYKFDPWDLPGKANFGENEWYFFSPRDRKYPNGARPNRAAASGYWKATGTDKPILTCGGTQKIGVKKALVFYRGRPPKGIKTNWIMHEYRLIDGVARPTSFTVRKSLRLDDWVLCRIYKKSNHGLTARPVSTREREESSCVEEVLASLPDIEDPKLNILPRLGSFNGLLGEPDGYVNSFFTEGNVFSEANTSTQVENIRTSNSMNQEEQQQHQGSQGSTVVSRSSTLLQPGAGIFPKPENIDVSSDTYDTTSLRRLPLEYLRDDGMRNLLMMNLNQRNMFQQQKLPHNGFGEFDNGFRSPFPDVRQRFSA